MSMDFKSERLGIVLVSAGQCALLVVVRTYEAHFRGRRQYLPVGLTTAIQAADTSFMSYASPLCVSLKSID
jgi:hypothetical protein